MMWDVQEWCEQLTFERRPGGDRPSEELSVSVSIYSEAARGRLERAVHEDSRAIVQRMRQHCR